jgi:predicted transcriptional regulator
MTKEQIKSLLESVHSWPVEDQEELVELAREIKARRTGVYVMDDDERAAVREGLEQARRGEFVSDEEMDAFWKKLASYEGSVHPTRTR